MECLNKMIQFAEDGHLFQPVEYRVIRYRATFYVDDMIMFLSPVATYLRLARAILTTFEKVTRLCTNFHICHIAPIQCEENHMAIAQQEFPCEITEFPLRYLGIHMSVTKLDKAHIQPMVDVVVDRLPTWKVRLMNSRTCLLHTKITLLTIPIYTCIVLVFSPWAIKVVDKLQRAFFGRDPKLSWAANA